VDLVTLIGDEDLDLAVTPSQLENFAAESLGGLDGDLQALEGFESEAVGAFADGEVASAELESLFADVVTTAAPITEDTLAADTQQLQIDLSNGDAILADLDALFQTPPPPTGGGSGGGGGGGGGGAGGGGGSTDGDGGGGVCGPEPITGCSPEQ